jgi:hypothetical protein
VRPRARVDANQPEIVKALRAAGASVQSLANLGGGVPDLLVGWRGVNLLFEVKDGAKRPSARRLTPDEERWHRKWRGQVFVVESGKQALVMLRRVCDGRDHASVAMSVRDSSSREVTDRFAAPVAGSLIAQTGKER